jgi:tetratricopeptide (TPR) repeat protein
MLKEKQSIRVGDLIMARVPSKSVIAAVAALFLFAGLSLGQTGSIEGKVIGEDGQPLKDALIKIERKDIRGNYQVKTKKKGDFFHAGLPLGTYRVVLEVNGQPVDQVDGVRTSFSETTIVNFNIQELKKRQQALQAAAESGTLTKEQARELSAEQREALERQAKERQAQLSKNKELNDAFNTGMTALQAKQWDAAIESFSKAAELDPKQHVVWAQLAESHAGLAMTKTGADREASTAKCLENWAKAIELKPDDAAYHNNYALALARASKFEEAQAELTKSATIDPKNAGKYYYNLGAVLTNIGQLDPAGEAFKKATEADPEYAPAQYQYGLYLMSKAQTTPDGRMIPLPGTKEAFEKYLKIEPTGANAEAAKAMIASMEQTIQTEYSNPAAKQKEPKKKK